MDLCLKKKEESVWQSESEKKKAKNKKHFSECRNKL